MILGIVAPYATLRQAPVPRTAGDSTMAYDALRTIMPIAGWPEEPFSTSFSRAAGGSSAAIAAVPHHGIAPGSRAPSARPADRDPTAKRKDKVYVPVEFKILLRAGAAPSAFATVELGQRQAGGAAAVLVGARLSGRQPEPSGSENLSMDAMVAISQRIRSGGHWNSNLSPIIAQQRREPGCSRRKPQRPGSKIILGKVIARCERLAGEVERASEKD
jgi:hypothetical protein